jgi:predicted nuclease of predicted toxin-antitoxin system
LKFLIDQNLPVGLLDVLHALGHEALHVKQLGLSTASDHHIWDMAVSLGAVIVSKDSDFVSFVARGVAGTALVRLRIGNCANAALYDIARRGWANVVACLDEGETIVEVRT